MFFSERRSTPLHWLLLVSVIIAILAGVYKYAIAKDYDFFVEAPCDSTTDLCYTRDCSVEDECPPNNLSEYRVFSIPAVKFPECLNNSCENVCLTSDSPCEEVTCSEDAGDTCIGLPS